MNELRKALQYLVDDLELRARISKDGEIACGDGAYQQAKAALAQPEQEPMDLRRMVFGANEGCSDGNCIIRKPEGMHTNGGCRCIINMTRAELNILQGRLRYTLAIPLYTAPPPAKLERLSAKELVDLYADKLCGNYRPTETEWIEKFGEAIQDAMEDKNK